MGEQVKAAEREYIRIAEREGIENPRIEWGQPHGRLIGTVAGMPVALVISLSKGAFKTNRQKMMTQTNFRRAVREAMG